MPSTAPADLPTPLAAAVVLEAVQRLESKAPLDDAQALRAAFASRTTRSAQVLWRAWLLGQRLGLPQALAHWRQLCGLAAALLAAVMAGLGFGLARTALGEGRSINAVAAFMALLGPHMLALLLWLLVLALPGARHAGPPIGQLVLWLAARLPLRQETQALALPGAAFAVLRRHGLLGWLTGAISHGIWALALAITLAVLAFGFAFRAYALNWESTILEPGFFQAFVQATGLLPAWMGFAVPDAAAVAAAGAPVPGGAQHAWAWWLMGCVLAYGLLPRLLLLALCLWRWRTGLRRLDGWVDMGDPAVRRVAARLDALEPLPAVIDPEQRPPAGATTPVPGVHAPGTLVLLGFELPPEAPWPPLGLPAAITASPAWRSDGSAAARQDALARLARLRPEGLLVAVHAPSSPDRGTARFLRAAQAQAGRMALLLWPADAPAPAMARWRQWLLAEGLDAVPALADAAGLAAWAAGPDGPDRLDAPEGGAP